MIRSLWSVITVLAIANLLALSGFVGWLVASGRLDSERFAEIRTTLSETIAEEEARLAAEEREESIAQRAEEERLRSLIPPLTASDRLRNISESEEVSRQRQERLAREVRDLQRSLDRERQTLDARIEEFNEEKEQFESMRNRIRSIEGDEQFLKAVGHLEAQKPDRARDMLQSLMAAGEIDQAVSYLNAMSARKAAKVIGAFEEPAVAADLLERLRTRGTESRAQ